MNKISGACETIKKKKPMTIKSLESQEGGERSVLKNHWTKRCGGFGKL